MTAGASSLLAIPSISVVEFLGRILTLTPCRYGYNCRTMTHNSAHALKLNVCTAFNGLRLPFSDIFVDSIFVRLRVETPPMHHDRQFPLQMLPTELYGPPRWVPNVLLASPRHRRASDPC